MFLTMCCSCLRFAFGSFNSPISELLCMLSLCLSLVTLEGEVCRVSRAGLLHRWPAAEPLPQTSSCTSGFACEAHVLFMSFMVSILG